MDLAHWDLVDNFTLWEAACLAGGVDPTLVESFTSEQKAKASFIHSKLQKVYDMAIGTVSWILLSEDRFSNNETYDSIFPCTSFIDNLPSNQLIQDIHICLREKQKFNLKKYFSDDEDDPPVFSRESLDTWFRSKGFDSVYSFAPRLKKRENQPETQIESRKHMSDKLAKLNQASARFWALADRNDRGTHPDNASVVAWLIKQGFSTTLADKAATIIRPEWAPTGRKPDE